MLELENVSAGYGQGPVISNLSLMVRRGEVVTLLGRNGAGKSTTLKSIIRLVRPTAGRVRFKERDISSMQTHQIALHGIGYVPEERRIFPRLTVMENLLVTRSGTRKSKTSVREVLELFPVLGEFQEQAGGQLSGGQQQMLAIARALMGDPEILLLDEPSEGLAPLIIQSLASQIAHLKKQGLTILLCEQNLGFARSLSDKVVVIDRGTKKFEGTFGQLDADPTLRDAFLFVDTKKYRDALSATLA